MSLPAKSLRLMFVAPSAYTVGGVQVWLDYIVEGLQANGHHVVVGLVSGRFHDASDYLSKHPFSHVARIENPTGSAEGRIRNLAKAIRNVSPDIVFSVNIPDVYCAVERLRKKLPGIRSVMTLHGIQADFLQDASRYRHSIDGVICTNQLAMRMIESTGLSRRRIKYAPYGVDTERRTREPGKASDSLLRIAYVGRFDQEQKRVLDIPIILQWLENIGVPYAARFAGDGPLRDQLQAALTFPIRNNKVSMLGALSRDEVTRQIYKWADLMLVTSSWETGPIVIWEAMSSGIPVVTTKYVGSGAEASLIDRHNCLMFPIGDHEAAARAIAELQDHQFRSRLIENGQELHARKYTRQASVEAWHCAIDELMKLPPLSPGRCEPVKQAGRLDRVLGVGLAESLRSLTGRSYLHRSPGSEWPHSHHESGDQAAFLELARAFDDAD